MIRSCAGEIAHAVVPKALGERDSDPIARSRGGESLGGILARVDEAEDRARPG